VVPDEAPFVAPAAKIRRFLLEQGLGKLARGLHRTDAQVSV